MKALIAVNAMGDLTSDRGIADLVDEVVGAKRAVVAPVDLQKLKDGDDVERVQGRLGCLAAKFRPADTCQVAAFTTLPVVLVERERKRNACFCQAIHLCHCCENRYRCFHNANLFYFLKTEKDKFTGLLIVGICPESFQRKFLFAVVRQCIFYFIDKKHLPVEDVLFSQVNAV